MRQLLLAWCGVAACESKGVDNDGDGFSAEFDCDDSDPERSPETPERCDGLDNDCDEQIDESPVDGLAAYEDADGDGFGAEPAVSVACALPPSRVAQGGDCDDARPDVMPGARERCDGLDNDCDPETSESGLVTVGEQDAPGLQEALDAAVSGDIVRLCDGNYVGSLRLPEIALTIESQNGSARTTLAGTGGPVLSVTGGEIVLRGLHVTGGTGDGLTALGGGLTAEDAVVTVDDCLFTANRHGAGGAIGVERGTLTVRHSAFEENVAEAAYGGAILALDAGVTVEESVFLRNRAFQGGAMSVFSEVGAVISGTTFEGNAAEFDGGALWLFTPASEIVDSAFFGNVAEEGEGGALRAEQALVVTDSTFEGNQAVRGGVALLDDGDIVFERVALIGNGGVDAAGAVLVDDDVNLQFLDSIVHENESGWGGALDISRADDSTVVSTGTDWGAGATDNLPADVHIDNGQDISFGAEDFTCETAPARLCE